MYTEETLITTERFGGSLNCVYIPYSIQLKFYEVIEQTLNCTIIPVLKMQTLFLKHFYTFFQKLLRSKFPIPAPKYVYWIPVTLHNSIIMERVYFQ